VQEATGTVSGNVILERRDSNAGATVTVDGLSATTPEDGSYTVANVPPGDHTVSVSRMSYLRTWREVTVTAGETLSLPDVTLLGGDVNQDDYIHNADQNLIGQAWNTTPADLDWDARADITDDDNVNVLDMVAVQFNWGQEAPGPWATTSKGRRVGLERAATPEEGMALDTQVVISPSLATLTALGQTVELEVQVQEVTNLYSVWMLLTFDPSVIQVRDADPRPSAPGVQIRPGDFLDPINQFVSVNQADNTEGTVEYAVTQLRPAEARSGSGVLATVEFEAKGAGSSAVHLDSVELLDDSNPEPLEIPAGTQDGMVIVTSGQRFIYLPIVLKSYP
jgi:hypothetical protein